MTDKIERELSYTITLGNKVIVLTYEEYTTLKEMLIDYNDYDDYYLYNS